MNTFCCKNVGILTLSLFTAVLASNYLHRVSLYLYCIVKPLQFGVKMMHFGVKILAFWCKNTYILLSKYLHLVIKIPTFWNQKICIAALPVFWHMTIFEAKCLHLGIFGILERRLYLGRGVFIKPVYLKQIV
jgi:hypothetical protein